MKAETKDFLERFQKNFGDAIRTPLSVSTGKLKVQDLGIQSQGLRIQESEHGPASSRLSVYNQQYWFRLFNVMQDQAPLTSRLLGLWQFNQLVQEFLIAEPPAHYDLSELSRGFQRFLQNLAPTDLAKLGHKKLAVSTVGEAFTIDQAFTQVFYAAPQKLWRPNSDEAARLPHLQLVASKALALFEEGLALLPLRLEILNGLHPGEGAVSPGPALPTPQYWALFRSQGAVTAKPLPEPQYRLYQFLTAYPLEEAMDRMGREYLPLLPDLDEKVMIWLSQSLDDGFWIGAEGP
ncbi:MAG: putative DNA-binding domain-containing protein [Oligoflexus sp.]|nr:putative DNA-binding domain-containing protein [Oligoflexus sp.]